MYDSLVQVFAITAFFDLFINLAPPPLGATLLRKYFRNHTPLAAALIAGFVGALTYALLTFFDVERPSYYAVATVFMVSALVGFPMQWSGFFPILNRYYYEIMPRYQSFLADGLSGVMVATVYWSIRNRFHHSLLLFWVVSLSIFFRFHDTFYP